MKINSRHVAIFLAIVLLSVGFGFAFDVLATALEKRQYPIDEGLADAVTAQSELRDLPEPLLWSVLYTGSGFASNAVSADGRIGLMQLTPADFEFICVSVMGGEKKDAGLLYDPETNLTAGCAYLAYLYKHYGIWDHALVAYRVGVDTVDAWLANPDNLSAQGVLKDIPDPDAKAYLASVKEATQHYSQLYYPEKEIFK